MIANQKHRQGARTFKARAPCFSAPSVAMRTPPI